MAQNEWFFDKKYNSWFYLKSDGSYAETNGKGPTITNHTVIWPRMSGSLIRVTMLGII